MEEQTSFKLSIPGAIVAGAAIVSFAIVFVNSRNEVAPGDQAAQLERGVVEATVDDDEVLGDGNAPVTIIEFSDYQCLFCRRFWVETLPLIGEEYINTGKVKFVYRDFPLSSHPMALPYAEATECAADQGKFWEMHNKIFEEQEKLGQGTIDSITVDNVKKWAAGLGLNGGEFNSCLDSGKYQEEIGKDLSDGVAAGVSGTPVFFINGQMLRGALPFEAFQAAIESELSR